MSGRTRLAGGGVVAALLVLALLGGTASPGFSIADAPGAIGRAVVRILRPPRPAPAAALQVPPGPTIQASSFALGDIPGGYLGLYVAAGRACPGLSWQLLAGIGKVESDHGRSRAPGVTAGVNAYGCCAGPMQFNTQNGPPSTWATYGDGVAAHVYQARYAIPAAAAMLCANGLARPDPPGPGPGPGPGAGPGGGGGGGDPCPTVAGSPAQHRAVLAYNHACWYVHQVLVLAARYTATPTPPPPPSADPFVVAMTHNPRLATTTSAGCDPAPDLASGRLDLRVQSLLVVLAQRFGLRVSCLHAGHARYVAGTTRVSNHAVWRAVDIDRVDGQPVGPHSAAARALVAWLDGLRGPLRPAEVGSPFGLGHRPYFTDEDHQHHIHIGYGPM
jgi:hypothetical protein